MEPEATEALLTTLRSLQLQGVSRKMLIQWLMRQGIEQLAATVIIEDLMKEDNGD